MVHRLVVVDLVDSVPPDQHCSSKPCLDSVDGVHSYLYVEHCCVSFVCCRVQPVSLLYSMVLVGAGFVFVVCSMHAIGPIDSCAVALD